MGKDISNLAVIYARYSSHSQGEQSIEGQITAARKYAELKGYTIVHEYVDRAMTGRNDNRDDFQRMLSDTSKKQFSIIIVWKVDRFGRNREEITFNKYRCRKNGVRVEYVAENMPEGPESVILESVLEGMAEYYSLQLSQNIRRGIVEGAKKHHVVGGKVPLGYRVGPDTQYEIDPDTAPIVKMIFERYAAGETMSEITNYLNEKGFRTIRGKQFTKNSLPRILSNPRYYGVYVFKDVIWEENVIPAIIDKELFFKVQDKLNENKRMPSHKWNYADYILTDKLFCGYCGTPMLGESGFGKGGKKFCYYVCGARRRNKSCNKKHVRQDWIEPLVLENIQLLLNNNELMEFIAENTWQYYLKQDNDQIELSTLQRQLTDVENGINNLVKSIEAGLFNDAIKSRIEALEGQKTALQKAIAEKNLSRGLKLTKDHIVFFLEQFKNLDVQDRNCQRRLVETFINAIFLYDDQMKIAFNYSGDNNTITLNDIENAHLDECSSVCAQVDKCQQQTNTFGYINTVSEFSISWMLNVFIITYDMPEIK